MTKRSPFCRRSDDSLGYEFPFILRAVSEAGRVCALCPWSKFCRGCEIPCNDFPLLEGMLTSSSKWWPQTRLLCQQTIKHVRDCCPARRYAFAIIGCIANKNAAEAEKPVRRWNESQCHTNSHRLGSNGFASSIPKHPRTGMSPKLAIFPATLKCTC